MEHSIVASKSFPILFEHIRESFAVLLQVGWHVALRFFTRPKGFPRQPEWLRVWKPFFFKSNGSCETWEGHQSGLHASVCGIGWE